MCCFLFSIFFSKKFEKHFQGIRICTIIIKTNQMTTMQVNNNMNEKCTEEYWEKVVNKLMNLPKQTIEEYYQDKNVFDDRLDPEKDLMLFLANKDVSTLKIRINYHNHQLKQRIYDLNLQHLLSYYIYTDSIDLTLLHRDPNIKYLYLNPCFDEIIPLKDLPKTLTHIYLSTDYKYKDTITELPCYEMYNGERVIEIKKEYQGKFSYSLPKLPVEMITSLSIIYYENINITTGNREGHMRIPFRFISL